MDSKSKIFSARAEHEEWIEWFAKLGNLAKGVVYVLIGLLAVQAASGLGGKLSGTRGVLKTLADEPLGQILLGLLGVGLAFYAAWRFVQAAADPQNEGSDGKAMMKRAGYAASGVLHAGLAVYSYAVLFQSAPSQGGGSQSWTAALLASPFGQVLVLGVAAALIGVGIYQVVKAVKGSFKDDLKTEQMTATERKWTERAARVGLTARGIVYGLIGSFFVQAALQHDAGEAGGFSEALRKIAGQPYGSWLLATVAGGLMAYGIYCAIKARYLKVYSH